MIILRNLILKTLNIEDFLKQKKEVKRILFLSTVIIGLFIQLAGKNKLIFIPKVKFKNIPLVSDVNSIVRIKNMPKIIFRYDFKKDAWAWAVFAKRKSKIYGLKNRLDFIPSELLKKIRGKNKKSAEKLVYDYLINNPKKKIRKIVIEKEKDVLRNIWRKLENRFFKRLAKITQKPIFAKTFTCYFTTGFMCPYNEKENWFMVSMWHSIPMNITTICHEILHLQFLYYYREYCQKFLSEKEIQDLKEALTFLLNTNFNDLILSYDMGYLAHKKLRLKLEKIWKKEKDFGNFLDKAIQIVKNRKF